ncbi:hypothetical protein [Hymenobacter sp. 102]|uniref:hypothetical protein n=1 Tax=Hymenobacter sp. 102 TaxID=3403152 RepID=UPI003CEA5D37
MKGKKTIVKSVRQNTKTTVSRKEVEKAHHTAAAKASRTAGAAPQAGDRLGLFTGLTIPEDVLNGLF